MKNQVLTVEQILELKKLGFNTDKYSSMLWTSCDECSCSCIDYKYLDLYTCVNQCCVNSKQFPTC